MRRDLKATAPGIVRAGELVLERPGTWTYRFAGRGNPRVLTCTLQFLRRRATTEPFCHGRQLRSLRFQTTPSFVPARNHTPPGHQAPGPKPVAQCAPVRALSARARELDNLDQQLRQSLPPPLNERLRYAGLRGSRATLLAPSPAWASRARMAQPKILAALRALGVQAETILVKVVAAPPQPAEPIASLPLSAASARHLRAAAKAIADPELQALFLELASFAEKDSCS